MQPLDELRIEYKRLARHINFLSSRYSPAVARDLSASLRNWVQLASVIDRLAETNDWDLRFSKAVVPKAVKKILADHDSQYIPLPSASSSKNIQIAGVRTFNGKVSQDEMKKLYQAELSAKPTIAKMKYEDWLNNNAYSVRVEGSQKDIPRRIFIDRAANLLGGTHPISNFIETEHATWADPYIVDSLNTTIGLWPVPYAILMESAQEILRAFKPYLE